MRLVARLATDSASLGGRLGRTVDRTGGSVAEAAGTEANTVVSPGRVLARWCIVAVRPRIHCDSPGDHVVQSYDRDADLVASVGDYLVEAALKGAVSVVIAAERRARRSPST